MTRSAVAVLATLLAVLATLLAILATLFAILAPAAAPAPGTAGAQFVYGETTLWQLCAGADVVARARIVRAAAPAVAPGSGEQRDIVEAELVEVLKGDLAAGSVRFARQGRDVADDDENAAEQLLFLLRAERTPELAEFALRSGIEYVSLQEQDGTFALEPGSQDLLLEAARAYVAAASLPDPNARLEALRKTTLQLLASKDARLASSALRDWVLAGDVPLVQPPDVPVLEPLLLDPARPTWLRVALLAELERRGLVDASPHWARLLHTTKTPDLVGVARAAAAHPSPAVSAELLHILDGGDAEAAAAAAVSLGVPGNASAVAPLTLALGKEDARLRMAAIRGLGAIATPEARSALVRAADSHPDAATRSRARAEVTLIDQRGQKVQ